MLAKDRPGNSNPGWKIKGKSVFRVEEERVLIIIIPYKADDGISLKYTLRGIDKHLGGDVLLVGDSWGKCEHIPCPDKPGLFYKERNIFDKLLKGPDEFLMMNDDHFLLDGYSPDPYYFQGTLKDRMRFPSGSYDYTLENTFNLCGNVPYYDIHCPMKMQKSVLINMNYNWPEWGLCIKSAYMSLTGVRGEETTDLKFRQYGLKVDSIKEMIEGRTWFSTNHESMRGAMPGVLEELYPLKSKFEE